ncbi:lysylphosphatidylglycerol synthase transmembrane domain-containing protein [Cruoricaptor ignavus]|uniref:lysylphosphatidylglycerol synthase transmembrane domain-containing protein n=1 Tax=Cruoricaptor ignavus TaxID=1118202 RepID=UPI00370DDDBC
MAKQRIKKSALNAVKNLVSLALLFFVFRKIPLKDITDLWRQVNVFYLIPAAILFLISQVISALRLQKFFETADFPLSFRSNMKLYFVGMFYNFFIPGGIGGDAYKVFALNKKFGWNAKGLTAAIFIDRLIGLICICLIICILAIFFLPKFWIYEVLLFLIGLAISWFFIKKLFPILSVNFWSGLLYSIGVQVCQLICFALLLKSLGVSDGYGVYSLVFLLSSVLSLISFAGLGIREMLFLQASKLFEFSPEFSVSASLLFTVITAFFSLFGVYFQAKKLNLQLKSD